MNVADRSAELDDVKARQREMWGLGDYGDVASRIVLVSERLCERVDVRGGQRVLDVACGTGNTAIAAARRFADVSAIDFSDELLERARLRSAADGYDIDLRNGDAELLPFADDAFDVVLSTCGVMFAPDQERAAAELLRVCRPDGRIGLVNWTPDSWVGAVGRTVGQYVPAPPGVRPPVAWGDPQRLEELLGRGADLQVERRTFRFAFKSLAHHVEYLAATYPPVTAALSRLDADAGEALRRDLRAVAADFGDIDDGALALRLDYLEVVALPTA